MLDAGTFVRSIVFIAKLKLAVSASKLDKAHLKNAVEGIAPLIHIDAAKENPKLRRASSRYDRGTGSGWGRGEVGGRLEKMRKPNALNFLVNRIYFVGIQGVWVNIDAVPPS